MLKVKPTTPIETATLETLRAWNHVLSPDSAAAAIYSTFLFKLERIIFSAMLGDEEIILQYFLGIGTSALNLQNGYLGRNKPMIIRLLNAHDDAWFADSVIANGPKTWDAALNSAFHAAIEDLRARLGDDVKRWRYGAIHKMTYQHPLGMVKAFKKIFNRGPIPFGGDIDTVNMGSSLPSRPDVIITVPSYRQIVNLADPKSSLSIHHPGQSGHPASKHYDDFIKPWLRVEHHPMLFERKMVEENADGTLRMKPK